MGLPCFARTAVDDLAPASAPATLLSVRWHTEDQRPGCVPLWLEPVSVFGSSHLTMLAAVHLGWACHPVWPSNRLNAGSHGNDLAVISAP